MVAAVWHVRANAITNKMHYVYAIRSNDIYASICVNDSDNTFTNPKFHKFKRQTHITHLRAKYCL